MNKNSILAFVLIIATVALFSSPQYNKFLYEKILKKPYPETTKTTQNIENNEDKKDNVNENINKEITIKEEKKEDIIEENKKDTNEKIVKSDTIWVENNKVKIGIDKLGASIISVQLKNYKEYVTQKNIELMDTLEKNGATISINGKSLNKDLFELNNINDKNVFVEKGKNKILTFETVINNEKIIKEFEIGDDYKIGITIRKIGLAGKRVKLSWNSGIVESENNNLSSSRNTQQLIRQVHYYNGDNVQSLKMTKEGSEDPTGNFKWVGLSSKYFMIALVSDSIADADISIKAIVKEKKGKIDKRDINYKISYEKTAEKSEAKYWVYIGPSKYEEYKKYHIKFEKSLFPVIGFARNIFWADKWFPMVAEFILWTLLALNKIFKDYGISILLLTLLSKIITYPLTHSSMKSMNRMKDVQPKIENIRKKHKNNPKKLNEEIMSLYKEEGINPLNPGCLPMFLQMPIFIALFVVLRKAIELREATTILLPWINDLSKAEAIFRLGTPLPMYGDNVAIMPIIMGVVTYFQNKMTIKDPNQKAMIYIMPIFMLALFNSFPSGLVLYWTFSSALALVQQVLIGKMKKK